MWLQFARITKTDDEPTPFTLVGNSADSPEPLLRPSPTTGHDAEILDVSDPYLGYEAEAVPWWCLARARHHRCTRVHSMIHVPNRVVEDAMPTDSSGTTLRLWAFGDAHVGTDKRHGRDSLAEAIIHSESGGTEGGPPFAWDLAIDVGDMSGAEGVPQDEEGAEVVRQFRALTHHQREEIYDVCGNHDRSGLDEPDAWWWQKWVDPLGQHTPFSGVNPAKRPYPIG
jgi:hypothetical protein